ncbi:MAG: argininosuccinate synthase domain-containing protein [Bacteroidota bacterium]
MENRKIILAFSGGLDTTYCAVYLKKQGYEVYGVLVNTGGFDAEEVSRITAHASKLGLAGFECLDVTKQYYDKVIRYLVYGNVLKNNTYPLSVSAERIVQAVAVAEYARKTGAVAVAHGSTGAGNDQVRFDMVFAAIIPDVAVVTPIRDLKLTREDEIIFLKEHGVEMNFEKAQYSINKGLWGTSVGGKETLTSHQYLPESAFPTPITKTGTEKLELAFEKGELTTVNGQTYAHPSEAIQAVEAIAAPFGIGRDIHVGDTIIGIKGRVGFEAAGALVIIKAHHLLEKHTLTKWQLYWKDQLSQWYGNWLHEGQYLDPVMRNLEVFLKDTQKTVSGKVFIELSPEKYKLTGIESVHDLMQAKFGSYGEMNNAWSGEDVKGFSKIFGNQNALYQQVNGNFADTFTGN